MTAKTIATAVNKNSLDTLSTLEAPKERRTSWYLKGLPGCRAAGLPGCRADELPRSPAETSRNPSHWHAITGPGTDVCCCVISINGVLAGIAVTVATAVTYSSQMLFVFICQHATSSPFAITTLLPACLLSRRLLHKDHSDQIAVTVEDGVRKYCTNFRMLRNLLQLKGNIYNSKKGTGMIKRKTSIVSWDCFLYAAGHLFFLKKCDHAHSNELRGLWRSLNLD